MYITYYFLWLPRRGSARSARCSYDHTKIQIHGKTFYYGKLKHVPPPSMFFTQSYFKEKIPTIFKTLSLDKQFKLLDVKDIGIGFLCLILTIGGELYTRRMDHFRIGYAKKLDLPKIKNICCGSDHYIAVSWLGEIFMWGDNQQHQLGLEKTRRLSKPLKIEI